MELLDDRSRALAHSLLREPRVIESIANDAKDDETALMELTAVAWLFAKLALELEQALALAPPPLNDVSDDYDVVGDTRWALPAELVGNER